MLKVTYDPENGSVVPDSGVPAFVEYVLSDYRCDIKYAVSVGSEVLINGFRLAVCRAELDPDEIVFIFKGEELVVNAEGRLPVWPRGFCDLTTHQLSELLDYKGSLRRVTPNSKGRYEHHGG